MKGHSGPSRLSSFSVTDAHVPLSLSESSGPGQQQPQQEQRSFRSCALSRRFILHVVWLSTIQLWHYLFIGTLNSLLTSLAGTDSVQGMWWASKPSPHWSQVEIQEWVLCLWSNVLQEGFWGPGEQGWGRERWNGRVFSCPLP